MPKVFNLNPCVLRGGYFFWIPRLRSGRRGIKRLVEVLFNPLSGIVFSVVGNVSNQVDDVVADVLIDIIVIPRIARPIMQVEDIIRIIIGRVGRDGRTVARRLEHHVWFHTIPNIVCFKRRTSSWLTCQCERVYERVNTVTGRGGSIDGVNVGPRHTNTGYRPGQNSRLKNDNIIDTTELTGDVIIEGARCSNITRKDLISLSCPYYLRAEGAVDEEITLAELGGDAFAGPAVGHLRMEGELATLMEGLGLMGVDIPLQLAGRRCVAERPLVDVDRVTVEVSLQRRRRALHLGGGRRGTRKILCAGEGEVILDRRVVVQAADIHGRGELRTLERVHVVHVDRLLGSRPEQLARTGHRRVLCCHDGYTPRTVI